MEMLRRKDWEDILSVRVDALREACFDMGYYETKEKLRAFRLADEDLRITLKKLISLASREDKQGDPNEKLITSTGEQESISEGHGS